MTSLVLRGAGSSTKAAAPRRRMEDVRLVSSGHSSTRSSVPIFIDIYGNKVPRGSTYIYLYSLAPFDEDETGMQNNLPPPS
jgi:hypothetical protein